MAAEGHPDDAARRIAALESELWQERMLLQIAAEAARVGFYRWNVETDEVWITPGLARLYGLDDRACLVGGEVFRQRMPAEDVAAVTEAVQRARDADGEFYAEFRTLLPSGQERWLAGRGRFVAVPGRPGRILMGANWDISPTKLETSKVRQILDGLGALAGLMTRDGILIEANRMALEAGGLAAEDVLNKPFWDTYWWSYDPAVQARLREAVAQAAAGETVRYDVRVRAAEGAFLDIDFTLSPLRDADGTITHLIPSAFEITGRKQAEARVQLVNRELRHRIANVFTVINSLLRLSAVYGRDVASFVEATTERLRALEAAHRDTGGVDGVDSAGLHDLARQVLRPWRELPGSRLRIRGTAVQLSRGQATALGLIFHELATNAAKYGGLAVATGSVHVHWQLQGEQVVVVWEERGVGPVQPPTSRGFGLSVIETLAQSYLDGDVAFDFGLDGLTVRISAQR